MKCCKKNVYWKIPWPAIILSSELQESECTDVFRDLTETREAQLEKLHPFRHQSDLNADQFMQRWRR